MRAYTWSGGAPLGGVSLTLTRRQRPWRTRFEGLYPTTYGFRSSIEIFSAMAGNSFGSSTLNNRPPESHASSATSSGPLASSGVRAREARGSKIPTALLLLVRHSVQAYAALSLYFEGLLKSASRICEISDSLIFPAWL